jgi:hypothetical protein
VGAHARYDFNAVSRAPTADRVFLTAAQLAAVNYPSSFLESDRVHIAAGAVYAQATTHWNSVLRSVIGAREDYQHGTDVGTNSGTAHAALFEPKASLIFEPTDTQEYYASAGKGFHSDDLRGTLNAQHNGIGDAPLISSQTGEEIGWRQQFRHDVAFTLSVYNLDAQSETTYDPDVGQDSAGPASRRYGSEINITYQATRWLEYYVSYSLNHSRFLTPFDDGTGHIGYFLPNAPLDAGSVNLYLKDYRNWSGGLNFRYLGRFPLSADNVVVGHGYGEFNGDLSYQFDSGWRLGVSGYNLTNTHKNGSEFWYVGRLRGEPAEGVAGLQVHPLEPINFRVTLTRSFGS